MKSAQLAHKSSQLKPLMMENLDGGRSPTKMETTKGEEDDQLLMAGVESIATEALAE